MKLDFFPKIIDAAMLKRTNFGALISILMISLATILCISETIAFIHPPINEQLVSVSDLQGALSEVTISFNFTVSVPCVLLHLDVFDTLGLSNDMSRKSLYRQRVDLNGKEIKVTSVAQVNGSCYGAETQEQPRCKTCEDIVNAYQKKGWSIRNMSNWAQCREEGIKYGGEERCRAFGSLRVNAIEGGFHLAPGINVMNTWGHQHDMSPLESQLNLSHEIEHVVFGASLGPSPLDGTRVIQTTPGDIHYRYNLKAVPTVRTDVHGKTTRGFQYTVNYAEIPVKAKGRFGPGIFFTYNFAPVAVMAGPDRTSFFVFLARIVSIIGGAFMLGRLIDSFGFRLHTIEGKMRIGKFE